MAKKSRTTNSVDFFDVRYLCECIGTMMLVLIGCSAIVLSGFAAPAGALQIGAAFGLAWTAVAYSFGTVSGGHINPAVTAAMWSAGRIGGLDAIMYVIYQVIGGIIGAGLIYWILQGKGGAPAAAVSNLGQNIVTGGYTMWAALGVEFIATLIFTMVILGVTATRGMVLAGLIVGLTLLVLHLAFISVNGLSVNPARSIGPAVWVRGIALEQVWIFIVSPIVAGLLAGWMHKSKWFG